MQRRWKRWAVTACATLMVLGLAQTTIARADDTTDAWLGVSTQGLGSGLRDGLDYDGDGVLVTTVYDGSPADRAGIRKGDVIVTFNSRTVTSPSALGEMVRAAKPGQAVSVSVWRHGTRQTLRATLAAYPGDGMAPRAHGSMSWDEDGPTPPMPPMPPMAPMAPMTPMTPRAWGGWGDGTGNWTSFSGRGRLGVTIQDIGSDLGEYFGVTGGKGALISEVVEDSPAERAGLKAGDVIVKVGDETIDDTDDLSSAIRGAPAGVTHITVVRKGTRQTFDATLGERAATRRTRELPPGTYRMGPGPGAMRWYSDDGDHGDVPDITIRRGRDSDGSKHIYIRKSDGSDHHIIIDGSGDDSDDDNSRTVHRYRISDGGDGGMSGTSEKALRREIDELQRQVEELKTQIKTPAPTPVKSTTKKPATSTTKPKTP